VFTHWHFDHNNGTIAYKEAFPNIQIISERESATFIELNQHYWKNLSTAPNSVKRQGVKLLQEQVANGKDSTGKELTAKEKEADKKFIVQRENELEELSHLEVVKPNRTFDGELKIDLGKKQVMLHDWGKANSPHDVTIYIVEDKILFSGDILVQSSEGYPFLGASWPVQWVKVLSAIERIPVNAIVLGHGPTQKDHGYTKQLHELLSAANTETEKWARQGKSLAEVQKLVTLEDYRKGPWDVKDLVVRSLWKQIISVLVERCWRGVRGQG
jgi:glyoxylase-like metal-dependent hydrolase (beta-lactamase superfamily II)